MLIFSVLETTKEMLMSAYELGRKHFEEGKEAKCPREWMSDARRAWFDGYYDALMEQRHEWWYRERWHTRNRLEETINSPRVP